MLPLGLSMLWESTVPAAALRDRFGFDDAAAATTWCAVLLDEVWGIDVREVTRVVISDQNVIAWVQAARGGLVVKWSRARDQFERLDASARLLRLLSERGVPVAAPVASLTGADRVVVAGPAAELSVAVLPELTGDWLDATNPSAVRAAGGCLAELHQALGAIGALGAHPVLGPSSAVGVGLHADAPQARTAAAVVRVLATEPVDWQARVATWLDQSDGGLAPAASQRLGALLASAPRLDDAQQLVHNDFRAANILTRDSRVVGVLDFDDVAVAPRVYDLAKASVYLGTLFTGWGPIPPPARDALRAGYESVCPLTAVESHWLELLTLWLGLLAAQSQPAPERWLAVL